MSGRLPDFAPMLSAAVAAFTLPSASPAAAPPGRAAAGTPPTVLLGCGCGGAGVPLAAALLAQGVAIRLAHDLAALLAALHGERPAAIVVHRALADGDAFDLLRALRPVDALPIVVLAAPYDAFDHALALELGADDYLPADVPARVVAARLRALWRRGRGRGETYAGPPAAGSASGVPFAGDTAEPVLRIGALALDAAAGVARHGAAELQLSAAQFGALRLLAERAGTVVARARVLAQLGRDAAVHPRAVDVLLSRLRRQLQAQGADSIVIQCVRGRGYRLVEHAPRAAAAAAATSAIRAAVQP